MTKVSIKDELNYKKAVMEYYNEKSQGNDYYKYLSLAIAAADELKTRRTRLIKLYGLNQKLVDGYLYSKYDKNIYDMFPECIDTLLEMD